MAVHHFIRRTVEVLTDGSKNGDVEPLISPLAGLVFMFTIVFFAVVTFTISYTYGRVLPVLCIVESPETSSYVPVNNIAVDDPPAYAEETDEDGQPKPADEINLVRNKPVTSSIRATIRHLRARAGRRSIFRGFWIFFVTGILRNVAISFLTLGSRNPILIAVSAIIAEVLLANFHMTWVHIVISEPSPKRWLNRMPKPAFTAWRRIAPAVALFAIATQIVCLLPLLVMGIGVDRFSRPNFEPGRKDVYIAMSQMTGALALMLVLFVVLQVPAMVTMVRVAASMLPEEDETIVPFDRTFSGKVTPAIVGGEGKIDLVEAWRSFGWASRRRLLALMLKVTGVALGVWFVYVVVLITEVHLLLTHAQVREIMKLLHGQ